MQVAGARRVNNAEGIRRIVRKHDCALPAQYTKDSNARGHSLTLTASLTSDVGHGCQYGADGGCSPRRASSPNATVTRDPDSNACALHFIHNNS